MILFSCNDRNHLYSTDWNIPVIIDTLPSSSNDFNTTKINNSIGHLIYIGSKSDTVFISNNTFYSESSYFEIDAPDSTYDKKNSLEIIPDLNQSLSMDLGFYLFPDPIFIEGKENEIDDRKTDSVIDVWENKQKEYFEAFPVFVRNIGKDTISIDNQDSRLFVIQEAKDPNGVWRPIEYWFYSDCGNSYGYTLLGPKEFIVIKKIKYTGVFKTNLRLKLKSNNSTFYSKVFKGSVNLEQFEIANISSWNKDKINDKDYLNAIFLNN